MKKPLQNDAVPSDTEISFEQVKALAVGSRVNICGKDSEGQHRTLECTVAGLGERKFLTYRDAQGTIKRCPIKEYPGKHYTKVIGG